jgi:hypothetical protein
MALTKTKLDSSSPMQEMEVLEIPPLVKDGDLGKYVFLYDFQTNILTPEAEQLLASMPLGGSGIALPKGSSFTLKYSKGDVVNVVDFRKLINDKGVTTTDKSGLVIKVPIYVKPIGGSLKGFAPTITIDNYNGWLEKVAESTPVTTKLGQNFGKNLNPKMQPVLDNPVTPPPTDTPVVTNGVQDSAETKSFFDDKNNLLMIAGVLLIGYLLLNDKSE